MTDSEYNLSKDIYARSFGNGAMAPILETTNVLFTANPYTSTPGVPVNEGGATGTLTRTHDGLGVYLNTQELLAGTFTAWWAIFNDPSQCINASNNTVGKCDQLDLMNTNIATLLRTGGDVVDDTGNLKFSSWISKGELYGDEDAQLLSGGYYGGLTDPINSEVQLIMVWHGEPLPLGDGTDMASLEAQMHHLEGGCGFYREAGGMDPAPIQVDWNGPFEVCPSLQIAIWEGPSSTTAVSRETVSPSVQTANVHFTADPYAGGAGPAVDEGEATATLTRADEGVGLYLESKDLPVGTYTAWWAIYNDPSLCANGSNSTAAKCDEGDLVNTAIATLLRAGGDVVDASGKLQLTSWLPRGDLFAQQDAQHLDGGYYGGLTDSYNSEVQIMLVWHGLPLPLGDGTDMASIEAQIHNLEGGCAFYRVNGGMEPTPIQMDWDGAAFEACPMVQSVVFPSLNEDPSTSPPPESEDPAGDDDDTSAGFAVGAAAAFPIGLVSVGFVSFL